MNRLYASISALFLILLITEIVFAQTTSYRVIIKDLQSKEVKVEVDLTLKDQTLYMSPYGPMPERWDDYVNDIQITDTSGNPITFSKSNDKWTVDAEPGQNVHLSYNLSVTHDQQEWPGGIDGVAFVNENVYFLTGRALFIMNGDENKNLHVAFITPDQWNVSTPWNGSKSGFSVNDHNDLMESLIMIGHHQSHKISEKDLTVNFVLSGDRVIAQSDQFNSIARKTMDYYIHKMGGTPTPEGNPSANIMVTINEADQVDGEVIGSNISILLNPNSEPQQQMVSWFMFAHEFFHLWNGKTLQVSGTKEDWFKEGITNYYTLKALYQIEFINYQSLAGVFNGLFYQRYKNDPGFGELSMREAAEGFDKDNHWGLIYGGGLFAGIALDVLMREETNNNVSLDDVMRHLYDKYSGSTNTYTTDEVARLIREVSGVNVDEFFETYINGTQPIPIEDYLNKAGFNAQVENGQLLMTKKAAMNKKEEKIHNGFLGE